MRISYVINDPDPYALEAAELCALDKAEAYNYTFAAATMGWCSAYCSARSLGSTPESAQAYADKQQRQLRKALGYLNP